jgi:protein-S-isoprenylcysteine O-methyltransferase Ste14
MDLAWRIGIDETDHTALVRGGLFSLSRNPFFLGLRIQFLGIFLTLPNALTLLALALGEVSIQMEVRLEELHLARLHGQAYRDYCAQTGRWFGGSGETSNGWQEQSSGG